MNNIVIIGGGLGGLTAGALLAKQGNNVTLLEQHTIVGGAATAFKRSGGLTFEVSLHELDNVFDGGTKERIFNTLGVYENIEFIKLNEFFRVKTGKSDFLMPTGINAAKQALSEKFPDEKEGIDRYFELISNVANEFFEMMDMKWWQELLFPFIFRSVFKYRKTALKPILDELIKDEELKLILITNIQYYHDTPDDLSFLYHSVAQYSYYHGGSWYIKGGSQVLSNYLASVITNHGGDVIKRANVIEILHKSKCTRGVVYEKKGKRYQVMADAVVSNASPMQTYDMANIAHSEARSLGISLLSLHIGFSKNLKSVYGERAYSNFYHQGANTLAEYNNQALNSDIKERTAFFVDYSQIDSGLTVDSKSLGVVCTADYLSYWKDLSENDYKVKKASLVNAYIKLLEEDYSGINELIEYAEIATAKTAQRYLKTPAGTPYGFAPTASQFFRKPEFKSNKLKNLYFVGAWVIGGGFTPAIMSGDIVAKYLMKHPTAS